VFPVHPLTLKTSEKSGHVAEYADYGVTVLSWVLAALVGCEACVDRPRGCASGGVNPECWVCDNKRCPLM